MDETVAFTATEAVYEDNEESKENKVYRGVVNTDGLNVRSAAGHTNPIMKVNGKSVILKKQDEVAVLDEVVVSNGKTWYKISFQWGDTLVVGYVNGTYVKLTTDVITPLSSSEISSAKLKKQDEDTDSNIGAQRGEKSGNRIDSKQMIMIGIGILVGIFIITRCFNKKDSISGDYNTSKSIREEKEKVPEKHTTYGYSGSTFDASSYVKDNCNSYIYGITSDSDRQKIENDPNLTSAQKEAVKRELKHQAGMYY